MIHLVYVIMILKVPFLTLFSANAKNWRYVCTIIVQSSEKSLIPWIEVSESCVEIFLIKICESFGPLTLDGVLRHMIAFPLDIKLKHRRNFVKISKRDFRVN